MTGGAKARWKDEDMADELTRKAVAFLGANQDRPFFLYFATHGIHVPRCPHPRFRGKSEHGLRGDAIVELDWCVGEILATLDRLNNASTTLSQEKVDLSQQQSDLVGADLATSATNLAQAQTTLNAALAAFGRISQNSLLDYLK